MCWSELDVVSRVVALCHVSAGVRSCGEWAVLAGEGPVV